MNLQLLLIIFAVFLCTKIDAVLRMSEDEISETFPVYQFIQPLIVDETGNLISTKPHELGRRRRRDVSNFGEHLQDKYDSRNESSHSENMEEKFYLNISAFGQIYSLVLKRKGTLLAPGAKILDHAAGGVTESLMETENVFTGYISNVDDSKVALTNFDGIAGYVRTTEGEFFVEPVDDGSLANASSMRHIMYQVFNHRRKSREKRARRRSRKRTYNIEVLLTVDYSVVEFHGRAHVKSYLTTLLNIVDEIYKDESIGHNINIILVRVNLVNREQTQDLISHENPTKNLESVCEWTHRQYHADNGGEESIVYDHAMFLTRRQFGPMGMEGYAHVTGMCEPLRSCTLNHEDGFSSAFVVAHETGHVLGMEHDGERNKCGAETSMGSIMAPLVQAAFHRYHWSRCSKDELQSTIRKFDCLLNNPHVPDLAEETEFPGVYHSLDDQCRFDFGPGYRLCTAFTNNDVCKILWCGHDDNQAFCKTKNGPPIDGTACGEDMWCFKSHCVWRNQKGGVVDGGWGEWTSYGACSRSCGTGVRSKYRECDRPRPALGGEDCFGNNLEYDLCNTNPCERSSDYRAEQCKFHQKMEFDHRRHSWLPFENDLDNFKCELYCVSKETDVILSMGTQVADGTRCSYDDPYSVCVRGKCLEVGCDGVIESGKVEDECGVCDGNGRDCRRIAGTYKKSIKKFQNSFTKILTIPYNARHIRIRESIYPETVLALKNRRTGRWVINSNGSTEMDVEKQYIESGIKWMYVKRRGKEQIFSVGPAPTEYSLLVMAPKGAEKMKIHYSYILHSNDIEDSTYQFAIRKWYPCSVTCGRGTKVARHGCRHKVTKKWVRKGHCGKTPPKKVRRPCEIECTPKIRWHTGRWRPCSLSCGKAGVKSRSVTCQRQVSNRSSWKPTGNAECADLAEKPIKVKPCLKVPCVPKWSVGNWTECSVSCGEGVRTRIVTCIVDESDERPLDNSECSEERPDDSESCFRPDCAGDGCNDGSMMCKLSTMAKYCSVGGFSSLCCESCRANKTEPISDENNSQPES